MIVDKEIWRKFKNSNLQPLTLAFKTKYRRTKEIKHFHLKMYEIRIKENLITHFCEFKDSIKEETSNKAY